GPADHDRTHLLLQDERDDVARRGAKRDAHADLAHAPSDGISDYAVDPDRDERERDDAERGRQRADDACEAAPVVEVRLERLHAHDEAGIEAADRRANARGSRREIDAA